MNMRAKKNMLASRPAGYSQQKGGSGGEKENGNANRKHEKAREKTIIGKQEGNKAARETEKKATRPVSNKAVEAIQPPSRGAATILRFE